MTGLLLDTCAAMDGARGQLPQVVSEAIKGAAERGDLFLSVVTAWELALLASPLRKHPHVFMPSLQAYWAALSFQPGLRVLQLSPTALFVTKDLPPLHGDPHDRVLIATANELGAALVTCDTVLSRYEQAGLVRLLRY